ncbi:winged helix-turn-helix domain-containing protein [Methanobrevibacter sp.]|uniref:winged helix-turn-helix domain-containing protein n=1 Tax=Methanobrevibacter sp. TaxID=66852 RepID=UPI003890DC90
MFLNELLGENARIKILEELLTYSDSFLTADEISRMVDISSKTVHIHMNQLEEIGMVEVKKKEI